MTTGKRLIIGRGSTGSWRLPPDYDVESLRTDLEEAFAKGTFAWVSVETENGERGELVVNGRVAPFAAIVAGD